MEATPQPLEGPEGPGGQQGFFYYSRRSERENHGQLVEEEGEMWPSRGEDWINHAGQEKSKAYEGSRGGFELDSYI